jgi:hypothetical protein
VTSGRGAWPIVSVPRIVSAIDYKRARSGFEQWSNGALISFNRHSSSAQITKLLRPAIGCRAIKYSSRNAIWTSKAYKVALNGSITLRRIAGPDDPPSSRL